MTPFLGQIDAFAFDFAPRGWAPCNGQLLQVTQFTALFSLLGTKYGGDGVNTFGLPKLPPVAPNGPQWFIAIVGAFPSQ